VADTSLIWSIIARDRTSAVLNKLQAKTSSVGKAMSLALGPAIAPVAGVSAGAVMSLGSAFAGAGAAAGVFGAVAKTAMTEVSEHATKVEDLNDKIQLYTKQAELAAEMGMDSEKYLKKQAEAALELDARLANLPPETRNATMAFLDMKNNWGAFVDQNKPATFNIMSSGYKLMASAVKQLQPFFDAGAYAAHRLVNAVQGWVDGGGLKRMAATAGPALHTLTSIIMNVSRAVGGMFGKMGASQGQGILDWLDQVTAKWAVWSNSTQQGTGIQTFIEYVQTHGPQVAATLGSFASAAVHVAQAVSPLAPISLAIAGALSSLISAIPPQVITTLVAGFIAFNAAMRLYAAGAAIATAVQWAQNAAWLAWPGTWIIAGILALVGVIVLVATKTRFFQTIWEYVWGFLKGVGAWFAGPFVNFFKAAWDWIVGAFKWAADKVMWYINFMIGYYKMLWSGIKWVASGIRTVIGWIVSYYKGLWNGAKWAFDKVVGGGKAVVSWFQSMPGRIRGALGNMFGGLWSGFRGIINRIIGAWNRLDFTIGGGSFMGISFPSVTLGTPNLPYMATGGKIMQSGLIFAHRGEEVRKAAVVRRDGPGAGSGGGSDRPIVIKGDGSRVASFLLEILREAIRDKGGDPVKVLEAR
jgi:hypothetical protein